MEQDRPSGTAQGAAMVRALHRIVDDQPWLIDDPISARLLGDDFIRYRNLIRYFPFAASIRANFLMRNRYAEDCLAESLANGVRQYVLLGAGLDTFAYRQPAWAAALRIFEVDYPASQNWKHERLAAANISIPGNVTLVPMNLERVSLQEGLAAAGMDFGVPSYFSSLGVTQYLTVEAFDLTLKFVTSLPPGSAIVFSFVLASSDLAISERIAAGTLAAISAARGEPWLSRYSPAVLANSLKTMGFSKVDYFSTDAANRRYFLGRRDGLRASRVEQMMRAVV